MGLSAFLGMFLGLYLIVVAIFCVVHRRHLTHIISDYFSRPALIMFNSTILFILGLFIILTHPIFSWGYESLITLTGYLFSFSAIMHLLFPEQANEWLQMTAKPRFCLYQGVTLLVIGFYMAVGGFLAI